MIARWLDPDSGDWAAVVDRLPHDTYHLPGYVSVAARQDHGRPIGFHWSDDSGHEVFLPLLLRQIPGRPEVDAISPYGYPAPVGTPGLGFDGWSAAMRSLLDALRSLGAVSCFIRLNPLLPADLDALGRVGTVVCHGDTVAIDLTLDEHEIESGVRTSHRRAITRAQRRGDFVTVDERWVHSKEFQAAYRETMLRVSASDYYFFEPDYFEELQHLLEGHAHLVVVFVDNDMAAGGIFFESDGVAQYHLGATREGFLSAQPTKLMFDFAWRWFRARGNRVLHLGGGVGGADDSLLRFKAGFSPVRLPFHTFRLVVDEHAYNQIVTDVCGERPLRPDGPFPAYRFPN